MGDTTLPATNDPVLQVQGHLVPLTMPEVVIDLDTPLERLGKPVAFLSFIVGLLALAAWGLGQFSTVPLWVPLALFALCFLSVLTAAGADCFYVLDNRARRIDYSRTVFFSTSRTPVCSFDDVAAVTVHGQLHQESLAVWYWEYAVAVVKCDGEAFLLTDHVQDGLDVANANGDTLAGHLGVGFVPGKKEHVLLLHQGGEPGKVDIEQEKRTYEEVRAHPGFGLHGSSWMPGDRKLLPPKDEESATDR